MTIVPSTYPAKSISLLVPALARIRNTNITSASRSRFIFRKSP